jgi:predicted RNase H-like HicB family nuclease
MAKKKKNPGSRYPVEVRWSEEDQVYVAEVYDLPGCMADGKTEAKAVEAAREAAQDWIWVAKKEGREIPASSSEEPVSGKFVLRLPLFMHQQLRARARREGVPLNQLVIALLAQAGAAARSKCTRSDR